ncbi:MAG: hypothetical protein B6242_03080 [Anaerolineaceae bacterium 4572_78]|nr:MAG: hypothetical protein B6242_03080 [Anaerolineaceae bacterium 4572_78]
MIGLSFILSIGLLPALTLSDSPFSQHAGVVISFGDETINIDCIDLGEDGTANGEDVLDSTGLDIIIDYNAGLGGFVCKIGDVGCDFPSEPCRCQCENLAQDETCTYWTYNHLIDGQWQYSQLGITNYMVSAGNVDGWVWGTGDAISGATPPIITFDEICIASTSTPITTHAPTSTVAEHVESTLKPSNNRIIFGELVILTVGETYICFAALVIFLGGIFLFIQYKR